MLLQWFIPLAVTGTELTSYFHYQGVFHNSHMETDPDMDSGDASNDIHGSTVNFTNTGISRPHRETLYTIAHD